MTEATQRKKTPPPAPGIYYDIPNTQYHEIDAVSNSFIRKFKLCPAATQQPDTPTGPMSFGTAVHMLVLEGEEKFNAEVIEAPCKTIGASKYGLTVLANPGKTVVFQDEIELCHKLRDSIMQHPTARHWLSSGRPEVSSFAKDPETGLMLKSRADWINDEQELQIDLKVLRAGAASPKKFAWEVKDGYGSQAGWYRGIHGAANGKTYNNFGFIVVEKDKSTDYRVACFTVPVEVLDTGALSNLMYLPMIAECQKTGHWPNYNDAGAVPIELSEYQLEEM